jgi:acetylornithine deacetylase/succinyl-diaminopimelate desuccinylase-like protein
MSTPGKPMVMAHWRGTVTGAEGAPHVLFYGHYDVQPADPEDLWQGPAFEPVYIEGPKGEKQIRARGASDDKGQLMTFVEAARALIAETGGLPVPVTILFEGEEESGSPSLEPFLEQHKDDLKADVVLVCDTGMWDPKTPAITTMLRGMVGEEVIVQGPSRDLHSGLYGGAARNPIHVLSKILGAMHSDDGRIQIPGFYDGVMDMPEKIFKQWEALGRGATEFLAGVGLKTSAGETGRSVLEQTWARPTADVNGIIGGYTGEGTKTLIPAKASAKVSFRLVSGQNPEKIQEGFRSFVKDHLPDDCRVDFISHGLSPALSIDIENPHLSKARAALADEFDRDAVLIGCGGSIPIVGSFQEYLGIESLLVGFALDEDRIHSPNEKYDVDSFHHGTRSWARILTKLAG